MRSLAFAFTLVLALALAACGEAPDAVGNTTVAGEGANAARLSATSAAQDAHATPALQLAAGGLELRDAESGQTERLAFGTPRAAAMAGVARALGNPAEEGENGECGAGPLAFADFQGGLRLYFQNGALVGWEVDETSGFATASGIEIGMPRRMLGRTAPGLRVDQSTLGTEFDADGIFGLLSGPQQEATISRLWAGTTCAFR